MSRSRGLWLATSESSETDEAGSTFEAMLDAWRDQQLSRCLNERTISARERVVRRFRVHSGVWPWQWLPGHLEAWVRELRGDERRAHSTIRSYQMAVGAFCDFVCDPAYGWGPSCLKPSSARCPARSAGRRTWPTHTTEYEGRPARRSLTRVELQALFDAADDDVESIRAGAKKGWAPAFRDATMLKVTYALGLRRREVRMLERERLRPQSQGGRVRRLRGVRGPLRQGGQGRSAPSARRAHRVRLVHRGPRRMDRRRLADHGRPPGVGLWPSERGPLVSEDRIDAAFTRSARAAGLPEELTLHCIASQLRDAPDRRRLRRPVRPAAGGP